MTEGKHLKRLVRERAARTGESYSTARRHVLVDRAGQPATVLPAGLVAGYDTFGGGQHHESALLAHMLRQAGHVAPHTGQPYTEAMLCGLAGGIGFMYALFEYRGLPPILTIVAQHHPDPWLPAALGRLGLGYAEERNASAKPALAALHRHLDAGRSVCCAVARTALPWRAGHNGLATEPYPVVVAGHEDGTLWVDDEASAPRPIVVERFADAWSAHAKGRHHRLVVAAPAAPVDLAGAIRAAIDTTVGHLTGPVLGHSFDVNFGFSGMKRLAAHLRDTRKAGWSQRFAAPAAFALGLRRLYECLELQYTAPAATRPLYADFLDEAAGVVGDSRLVAAAELFRASAGAFADIASAAATVLDGGGPYADLVERRMFLRLGQPGMEAEVEQLSARIEDIGAQQPETSVEQRRALFDRLADLVDTARCAEEAAVAALT